MGRFKKHYMERIDPWACNICGKLLSPPVEEEMPFIQGIEGNLVKPKKTGKRYCRACFNIHII